MESERPKTHCEQHRDSVQTTSPEGYPIFGAYVPQCDPTGEYTPLQVSVIHIKNASENKIFCNFKEVKAWAK